MAWLPKRWQPGTSLFLGSEEGAGPWRAGLALDCSCHCKTSSGNLLHDCIQNQSWAGIDHRECGKLPINNSSVSSEELVNSDGSWLNIRVSRQDEGNEEVPPGRGEYEDKDDQQTGFHQGKNNGSQRFECAGAIDPGCFFKRHRDRVHEVLEHPHGHGQ